ncbi:hypothetical protein F2P56_034856 [Juglans regia]|uniref:Uncharacterized protein n=1 Tax=Juglans regia TaxID=51240 RepID=A0A833TLT3_JUGRE|nr:hypothetical protein F2P56_034856 [Juglans regia]
MCGHVRIIVIGLVRFQKLSHIILLFFICLLGLILLLLRLFCWSNREYLCGAELPQLAHYINRIDVPDHRQFLVLQVRGDGINAYGITTQKPVKFVSLAAILYYLLGVTCFK